MRHITLSTTKTFATFLRSSDTCLICRQPLKFPGIAEMFFVSWQSIQVKLNCFPLPACFFLIKYLVASQKEKKIKRTWTPCTQWLGSLHLWQNSGKQCAMEHLQVAEAKKQSGRTDSRKKDEIGQTLHSFPRQSTDPEGSSSFKK